MPGDRHRRGAGQVQALAVSARMAAIWVSRMPGPRRRLSQLLGGGHRLLGGQRADPLQRLEADRAHHDQLAGHRLEQQLGLPTTA